MADASASAVNRSLRLVMLGPPGSGKGTQAEILAERLGIPAISTGEMLRRAVASGSTLGGRVEAIMASGALVDDATMAEVVRERLTRDDAASGYLLDGYPRTLAHAATLGRILEENGSALDGVVFIDVPEDELVRRSLARQRADDTEEVVRRRQEVYREKTSPLIEYYEGLGLLLRIDGDRPIEEVNDGIRGALGASS
ncbi:MAG: adenylate kinase [Thermoanaerobaculia bacterium]